MFSRLFLIFSFLLVLGASVPSQGLAQTYPGSPSTMVSDSDEDSSQNSGFAKPYEYERQAYGYDPDGVEYKENQAEDFQVIFISSLPFTALASYGLTGLASLVFRGSFDVGGNYFLPFIGGIAVGSTTIACVSVLDNKYPPPASSLIAENTPSLPPMVVQVPLVMARF